MNFPEKFLLVSASIALALLSFNACSDDSGSSNSMGTAGSENENLGPCDTKTDGDIQYIKAEDAYYRCEDGKWELTIIEQSSSSKTEVKPSSSSKKQEVIPNNNPKSSSSKTEEKLSSSSVKPEGPSSSSEEPEVIPSSSSIKPEEPSSSSEEPSSSETCVEGNKYYDTSEHKAYQCINGEYSQIEWDLPETDESSSSEEVPEPSFDYGEMSDDAGSKYKTITIGEQTWMAENLNYATTGSYCYSDNDDNCTKYGRLYTWEAAKTACPTGWHLPSYEEWQTLMTEVGDKAGEKLKSLSSWNGINTYGFTVLPAGNRTPTGQYARKSTNAYFWSVTAAGENTAFRVEFTEYTGIDFDDENIKDKKIGYSVRCLMGVSEEDVTSSSSENPISSSSSPFNYGTMYDANHDRTYKTITIGSQIWMAENLNYQGYEVKGACYNNIEENCEKYGRLYTWEEAMKACPTGWHLPSSNDFEFLFVHVNKYSAGKHLKSSTGWNPYQVNATEYADGNGDDLYGFNLLPAGIYSGYDPQQYRGEGEISYLWTAHGDNETAALIMFGFNSDYFDRASVPNEEMASVRCVSDETVEIAPPTREFDYEILKDTRDNHEYRTIKIGDQNWMAENLNFAYKGGIKYHKLHRMEGIDSDGDILETDSTSWCYNNDPKNCEKFGRMYLWSAAMDSAGIVDSKNAVPSTNEYYSAITSKTTGCGLDADCTPNKPHRGACPEGWHVPSTAEFQKLFDFVKSKGNTGTVLKSTTDWSYYGNGNDEFGFSALPGGGFDPNILNYLWDDYIPNSVKDNPWEKSFIEQGLATYLWTSTQQDNEESSWAIKIFHDKTEAQQIPYKRNQGHYLRCVQDQDLVTD